MKLIFCTHNGNKLEEIKSIVPNQMEVLSLYDLGYHKEIIESGTTLEENSLIKAEHIYKHFQTPCFADDSGLEVEILSGAPGVLSARYAGEEKDDEKNIQKLLEVLRGKTNRKARFKTIITYIDHQGAHQFEGSIEGKILHEKVGQNGFGYDPIFQPLASNLSFGQMSLAEKNVFSHRKQAITKFINFLKIK